MKRLIILAMAIAASACTKQAMESSKPSGNSEFTVDKLFTQDGCTVYRFFDAGNHRYFVKCTSGDARTEWREGCGKNCSRQAEIPTGEGA
jgi:hypothetical protein